MEFEIGSRTMKSYGFPSLRCLRWDRNYIVLFYEAGKGIVVQSGREGSLEGSHVENCKMRDYEIWAGTINLIQGL